MLLPPMCAITVGIDTGASPSGSGSIDSGEANPGSGDAVSIYQSGGVTLAAIFADPAGETPLANPTVLDTAGQLLFYTPWATGTPYTIQSEITSGGVVVTSILTVPVG